MFKNYSGTLLMRLLVAGIAMFIAGIVFTVTSVNDSIKGKTPKELSSMKVSDFSKGDFVEGDIYYILDEFAYEESYNTTLGVKHNEHVSAHYYVVPLEGSDYEQYLALEIGNTEACAVADRMIDEFYRMYDGEEIADPAYLHVQGKMKPMDSETEDYLYEWLLYDSDSTRADYAGKVVPYILTYYAPGYQGRSSVTGVVICGIGAVLVAIYFVFKKKQDSTVSMLDGDSYSQAFSRSFNTTARPAEGTDGVFPRNNSQNNSFGGTAGTYTPTGNTFTQNTSAEGSQEKPYQSTYTTGTGMDSISSIGNYLDDDENT